MRKRPNKRMPTRGAKLPRLHLASSQCIFAQAPGEKHLSTFEGNAYTGAPMRPQGWWQDVIIDLSGVKVPSQHRPVLRQHDHEQIVGHTTAVSVDRDGIKVKGVLSGEEHHVNKVRVPAGNGFPWQLSVGADPIRTEQLKEGEEAEVNGRTVKGPMVISRQTRIGEVSFVPLGADGDTSVAVAAQAGKRGTAMRYSDEDIDNMSEEEAKAALRRCMAEDDEDDDEEDDDEGSRSSKSAKSLRVMAARELARHRLLLEIDAAFKRASGGISVLADNGRETGAEEAIRKGKSVSKYRREVMKLARSHGVNLNLDLL